MIEDNDLDDELEQIAIIGIAGKFPEAENVDQFWENLKKGKESVKHFDYDELKDKGVPERFLDNKNFVRASATIDQPYHFDSSFFGYSPREAKLIDPQHRHFLETAYEALENSGCTNKAYDGSIGVFAGSSPNYYKYLLFKNTLETESLEEIEKAIGNEKDYLATRVSYKLNLKGPSLTLQTACSTSLVAVHTACQSLLNYQCSIALAGATTINLKDRYGYFYSQGSMASPEGHCRTFDENANGALFGDGVGVVVLKRLSDAIHDKDYIYAVIKGAAINNDGSEKISFSAPSIEGQSEAIAMAHAISGVSADEISYVETHGTGTKLGDPIEIRSLTRAFGLTTDKKQFCAIGSVKPNIGHSDAAAGMASLIKLVKMIETKTIPPSINYSSPNPEIDFENSPFYVSQKLSNWEIDAGIKRVAGISCFGFGGTNAHAILEEFQSGEENKYARSHYLLFLSAKNSEALKESKNNLSDFLTKNKDGNLADVAYTLQIGRTNFDYRSTIVCKNIEDAIELLRSGRAPKVNEISLNDIERSKHKIAFMFSGQGSQYVNMGKDLYIQEPEFRNCLNRCSRILEEKHGINLCDLIYPDEHMQSDSESKISQTQFTQPALFAIEYSLAKLFMSWGIRPNALIGHSIGEYVAACLSGVFTLEEAIDLVAVRGRLMQGLPEGDMLAIPLSIDKVEALIGENISIAAINAPNLCVVSGNKSDIGNLIQELGEKCINYTKLHTSHAFHSLMMEPILDSFKEAVFKVDMKKPSIPFISNVYGDWIKAEDATNPEYWTKHIRNAVLFSDGMKTLLKEGMSINIEVGPGNTLCSLARQQREHAEDKIFISSIRHPKESTNDYEYILNVLGKLWFNNVDIVWNDFYNKEGVTKIPLPSYPFQRKDYRVPGTLFLNVKEDVITEDTTDDLRDEDVIDGELNAESNDSKASVVENKILSIWADRLGIQTIGLDENFFDLGGNSLIAAQIFTKINSDLGVEINGAEIFNLPTIRKLADFIEAAGGSADVTTDKSKDEISLEVALRYLGDY